MIAFKTSGRDNTPAATSTDQVSIPKPSGVTDGDLLVVAIAVKNSGSANLVTPSDESWTKVIQTDQSLNQTAAVFWKIAINEPIRWTFQLDSSNPASGVVTVFANTDGFTPIETDQISFLLAGSSIDIPAISAALNDETLLFFAAADFGTAAFATATNYRKVRDANQSAGVSLTAQYRQLTSAGANPSQALTFTGGPSDAACVALIISPSFGSHTAKDVFDLLIRALPRGVEAVYDLAAGGDYYKYFMSWALVLKTFGFDFVDLCRSEIVPYLSRYKLPDWEVIFGLTQTRIARNGTVPQRQAQILGAWRAAAGQGSSISAIRAAMVPVFGYLNSTVPEVIETSRAGLTTLHTYSFGQHTQAAAVNATYGKTIPDSGLVSKAGPRVLLNINSGSGVFEVILIAPSNNAKIFPNVDVADGFLAQQMLFAPELAGESLYGKWQITIQNLTGGSLTIEPSLIVEGIGPVIDTGGAIFHWGVYADPAHLGESGTPADLDAARALIKKFTFEHCIGGLIQSKTPYPDSTSGANSAIPNESIPV